MGILDGFRSKEAAAARAEAKKASEAAKHRDVIRQAIATEKAGGTPSAKDAQAVVDCHDSEEKYEESLENLDALTRFAELGRVVVLYDAEIGKWTDEFVKIANELNDAADVRIAASAVSEAAWPDGDYIKAADATGKAEAGVVLLRMQKNARGARIDYVKAKRDKLITQQAALECWIDPTSELPLPLNFALSGGPRERPETAKAAAAKLVLEARETRRREKKVDYQKQIQELHTKVRKLDGEIERLESKIDALPKDVSPMTSNTTWQALSSAKNERGHARARLAELEEQLKSLGR